jgi:hypothetical protein
MPSTSLMDRDRRRSRDAFSAQRFVHEQGVDRTAGAVVTPMATLRRVRGVKRFGGVLDTPQRFVDSAIYLAPSGKEHLGRSIV